MNTPGYESLADVLRRAYDQAAKGKGAERHAVSRPFTEQPMQSISALLGNDTGLLYQAMKKIQESQRLDHDAAIRELLGAINYIAGAVIFKETQQAGHDEHANEVLRTAGYYYGPASPATGARPGDGSPGWICYHGDHSKLAVGTIVPVGEACPVCHAIR